MAANAMLEDRDACFEAAMDDYVAKTIRPEELAEALSRRPPRRARLTRRLGLERLRITSLSRPVCGSSIVAPTEKPRRS
jgi:CheY-like chemotaxis protein